MSQDSDDDGCFPTDVSVLCLVCGETWNPDPADRGQDNSGQQHTLHHSLQTSADWPRTGNWGPGDVTTVLSNRKGRNRIE